MTVALRPPGDKSLSHRCLMLAPLARGRSRLAGLLDAADVRATARAVRALGARIPEDWSGTVGVPGDASFHDPEEPVDCGNSGTTARILAGLVVGLGRGAVLDGDASLRSRPMDRVVYPLQALGGRIEYLGDPDRLPVRIRARASGSLRELLHRPKVASAQVKSSLLMAGLASGTPVRVVEPGRSRDHTERLLRAMDAPVTFGPEGDGARVELAAPEDGGDRHRLSPLDLEVPGDASSAAFLAAAGLLGEEPVKVEGVGLNPTRTGFLEVLREMGGTVEVRERGTRAGEPVGELVVAPSRLRGFEIGARRVPRLLDEIPVLAVLAARAEGTSVVTGAEELRVKESDRLALLAANLRELGVSCAEREDGLEIRGGDGPLRGEARTGGDHRLAMAFGVLGAAPGCDVSVDDPDCVSVSYPGFWDDLARVRQAS